MSFDSLIALVVLYYFCVGLANATAASHTARWMLILAVLAITMVGSFQLMTHHHLFLAKSLLNVLAVPGFFYGLMLYSSMLLKTENSQQLS
ncbi:MAG: osmoprotectant transporter permease [Bacteroidota bacterium]